MSVAVIGASGMVGTAVVRALAARDPSVKASVRRPEAADLVRAAGAKVAVGQLDDPVFLAAVLGGAETVCHLAGAANEPNEHAYDAGSRASLEQVLHTAKSVGVRRVLLLSAFGAAPEASNPFLRAKGRAERLLSSSGLEHSVLRVAPVYGLGGFWFAATVVLSELVPPAVAGEVHRLLAPVFVDDVAAAFAALDDLADPPAGPLALAGPDRLSAGALATKISGRSDVRSLVPVHAHAALVHALERPVSQMAMELLCASGVPEPGLPDAAAVLGLRPTPLDEGLARVAALASGEEG
ncbi:MAG: NAD(P)H-binding protein [Actinomycetota bacterium]